MSNFIKQNMLKLFKSNKSETKEFKSAEIKKSVSFNNKLELYEFLSDNQRSKYESIIKSKLKKINNETNHGKKMVLYVGLFEYLANDGYQYLTECKTLQDGIRNVLIKLADDCPEIFNLFDEKTEEFVCKVGGILIINEEIDC